MHIVHYGSGNIDANDICIEEFVDKEKLVCIDDGRGTQYNNVRNTENAIDLTLTSSEIASMVEWEVLNTVTVGSNHYPIVIKIREELCQEET